jgi:regulator of nucleoside diphosphate kinase
MTHVISRPVDPRRPEIQVTNWDLRNIESLLSIHATHWNWRSVEYLVRELMRATVVEESTLPDDIVTMGSRVEYREVGRDSSEIVTVAYPGEREIYDDAISVLTPIGAALIGLRAGQSICFAGPDGRPVTIEVTRVIFQPEANRRARLGPAAKPNAGRRPATSQGGAAS